MNSIILSVVAIIIILYLITTYNKGIKLKNYVKEAFSTMDVYLKKRWDLIPNLVEIVKGYATHEKTVFEQIAALRSKSYNLMSDSEKLNVNKQVSSMMPNIVAVAENYPELKANTNFQQLMSELSKIEEDIANSRKYYNGTVRQLNTFVELFPSNIVCAIFGIHEAKLFEINEPERENVTVKF